MVTPPVRYLWGTMLARPGGDVAVLLLSLWGSFSSDEFVQGGVSCFRASGVNISCTPHRAEVTAVFFGS